MGNIGNEGEKEMLAFVLMPFDREFEQIYSEIIVPALESADYEVKRADSTLDQQNIMKNIIPNIVNADLIIAELSNLKPNVLYELGISHALLKPTVLLTQDIEEVPFDLRSYTVVVYSTRFDEVLKLKENLQIIAEKHKHGEIIFGNPVSDFAPRVREKLELVKSVDVVENYSDKGDVNLEEGEELDSKPGFLDLLVEGLDGIKEINKKTEIFTKLIIEFGEKAKNRVYSLSQVRKLDSHENINRAREISKELGSDMVQCSRNIEEEIPDFHISWDKYMENTTVLFSQIEIKTDEDVEVAKQLIETTKEFKYATETAIESTGQLESNTSKMLGISRDLDHSIKKFKKALSNLTEELVIGESYLSRLINILEDRIKLKDKE